MAEYQKQESQTTTDINESVENGKNFQEKYK